MPQIMDTQTGIDEVVFDDNVVTRKSRRTLPTYYRTAK